MPAKNSSLRRIDQPTPQNDPQQTSLGAGATITPSTQLTTVVEVPINVTAGATYIVYSHLTPTAAQELSWQNADPRTPEVYLIQWSTQSNFTNAVTVSSQNPFITISGLPQNTLIYYRVAARVAGQQSEWSQVVSATTALDTTPPAAVSNAQWQWSGKTGDLTITWTPPTSPNYKDTRIVIRASASGPILREVYAVAGRYVWTRAQQAADTGGSYDSNVVVELTPRNTSNVFGATISINPQLSAPSAPTGLTASWNGGTCTISWNSADVDFYRVTVNSVTRNVGFTNNYAYTIEQNAIDAGGTPNPSLIFSVVAVDALNQFSAASTINTTAPLPAQPTGLTTSWASDNGTAEADCVITWTQIAGVSYRLTIDSVQRNVGQVNRFVYGFAQNQQEHSGNAASTLAVSLVAVDPFGRASTAATTTATNAAPPSLSAPSVQGFFSSCRFSWSTSTARDFLRYELDIRINSTSVGVFALTDTTYTFETTQSGQIDARVRVIDRFGQASAWSLYSSQVSLVNASQFVQELRQGVAYSDSIGSSQSALAALKDSNLTSGGITYTSSTTWRWIEADHEREVRHQTATLATSTNVQIYYGTSLDGTTWTWYHGGSVSNGVWVPSSSTTSETTAQSGAITVNGTVKIRLSASVQCRFMRLGMRNTSVNYTIREFYPRSLVQADDIAGETLSAISANLGTITAGSISSVSIDASTITGGTITGSTVQTATSGSRVVLNSSGLFTYNNSNNLVAKIDTTTNGGMQFGNSLFLEPNKITFTFPYSTQSYSAIEFNTLSKLYFSEIPGSAWLGLETYIGGLYSNIQTTVSSSQAHTRLFSENSYGYASLGLFSTNAIPGTHSIILEANGISNSITLSSNDGLDVRTTKLFFDVFNFLAVSSALNVIHIRTNPIISSFANRYTALRFGGPAGNSRDFIFGTTNTDASNPAFSLRWAFRLTNDPETGGPGDAGGGDFQIISGSNNGEGRHVVLTFIRSSGHVGIGDIPSVSGGGVGSVDVHGDLRVRGTIRQKVNWTTFTLSSNWSDVGSLFGDQTVAYRIYADGTVELRGLVRLVSGTNLNIATLPTDARPSANRRAATAVWTTSSGNPVGCSLHILTDGTLAYNGPSLTLNNNHVSLYVRYSLT